MAEVNNQETVNNFAMLDESMKDYIQKHKTKAIWIILDTIHLKKKSSKLNSPLAEDLTTFTEDMMNIREDLSGKIETSRNDMTSIIKK